MRMCTVGRAAASTRGRPDAVMLGFQCDPAVAGVHRTAITACPHTPPRRPQLVLLVDDVLAADEVVAFTEVHKRRSRAVMERLGMSCRREIRLPGLVEGVAGMVDDAPFALYVLARTPHHAMSRRRHRR